MLRKTLLISLLTLTAAPALAADSWFDTALEFFGWGSEPAAPEQAPPAPATPAAPTPAATNEPATATEPAAKSDTAELATQVLATAEVVGSVLPVTDTLTGLITANLGVDEATARGALGTMFNIAKATLSGGDFQQISQAVPDMNTLLASAPALSEQTQGLSALMGKAGKYGGALKTTTEAYAQFKSLGVSADQIPQYIGVTSDYLTSEGGAETAALFQEGLGAMMPGE